MALPKLKTPTYEMIQPSTKKPIKFRPFLVKEEKIMLMAKESGNQAEMIEAMRGIVDACTFGKLDMLTVPLFDLEFMFLQLRARSVSENSTVVYKCQNKIRAERPDDVPEEMWSAEETTCDNTIEFTVNLLDVQVEIDKAHTNTIIIDENDGIGITLHYPQLSMIDNLQGSDINGRILPLIKQVFDKENVYRAEDVSQDELIEFIDNLSYKATKKIKEQFFDTMPVLKHTVPYRCSKCGYEGTHTFQGHKDFFF